MLFALQRKMLKQSNINNVVVESFLRLRCCQDLIYFLRKAQLTVSASARSMGRVFGSGVAVPDSLYCPLPKAVALATGYTDQD